VTIDDANFKQRDDSQADHAPSDAASDSLPLPKTLRQAVDKLTWQHEHLSTELQQSRVKLEEITGYLEVAEQVTDALDVLSQKLFEEVLGLLRDKLSIAIQEVLEQPVFFKAEASFKRGAANVDFSVERNGNQEDVNRGQGGSVQNVLSVGLRLFALARLDQQEHRRFLVLDEQDCWLRPELVPRLVNIVYRAAKELDFQVIMISHHDVGLFEKYADRIYQFDPDSDAVQVAQLRHQPTELD